MHVLVLQHIACEPPGVYEDVLRERGAAIERIELDDGEGLPERTDFDAVIAMAAEHPWLSDEKRFIAEAVGADTPFWGVCLGVQLLASSLGARVYAGPRPRSVCCRSSSRRRGVTIRCSATLPTGSSRSSGTATRSSCPTAPFDSPRRRRTKTRRSGCATPTASSSTSR